MLIAELLLRKLYLQDKIAELNNYMKTLGNYDLRDKGKLYSTALNLLFELTDRMKSYSMMVSTSNAKTTVQVGTSTVTVEDAVMFTKALECKITALTNMINSNDLALDIFLLLEQRDKLLEDFFTITSVVRRSDWSTEI